MTPLAKRLSIALALSIALNLLIGGILIGRAFRQRPPERDFAAMKRDGERPQRDRWAERRGPLREVLREHRDALRERNRAIGDARRAAKTALEAEPFDRAALERSLEALRKETTASQEVMHRAIVEAAATAPAEERRKLARGLDRATLGRDGGRGPGPPRGR